MKIVVDRDIPFLSGVFEPWAEVVYLRGDSIGASDVLDADAILTRTRTRCDAALLEGSTVRFIGTATIGFDHIDMEWCTSRGIRVVTAAGCNRRGVLQWVSAALAWLAGNRGLKPSETTLGVVGVGNVGSLVARYAAKWGFRVMCSDPPRERAEGLTAVDGFHPLSEIVEHSDVLTFHTPLTTIGPDATRHLVDREFVTSTRPGAVIFNSSRGAIIEPGSLRGSIRDYIADTWNAEPHIDREVLNSSLLGTPHIAGYSLQGKATGTAMVVNALAREFDLPLPAAAGLDHWYPEGAPRSEARDITWDEMCAEMPSHFDIAAESAALKSAPDRFEAMRDNYDYRLEFF
ncbi:MAG: 4-phosphoerythronate dehydrogenase [Alistipes sp.]|jgi:erythronate-4-phosphate dehydrogenase|nr:4-phosphoerythronate dehydrogenase [Alistipes sp.]